MKRVPKRKLLAVLAAASILLLGGCWDNKDINHRSLPIVMGIGKSNGVYAVYLQLPLVTKEGLVTRIVSGTGPTISEVVDRISTNMESRLDLLHMKVILVDKAYAQQGMNDGITSFMRSRDLSPKTMVAITEEPIGLFFKEFGKSIENNQMLLYNYFEKSAGWNPEIAQTRLWQLFRSINSFTHDVAVPILKLGKSTPIEIMGAAVIKNGRMVDRIGSDETMLLNVFNGMGAQGKIEVMDHATVLVLSNRMTHKSRMSAGRPVLDARIAIKVSIMETEGNPTMQLIQHELERQFESRFSKLFAKTKAHQADILGVGQYFRTKIPREQLAKWRSDYLPYMDINVKVNAIIQNEGNINTD